MKRLVLTCALVLAIAPTSAFAQKVKPAAPAASAAPANYRINPGDELEIFVWGEDRLQRSVHVLPDGTFSFPLIGKVEAANALPSEIEARITKALEPQYRNGVPQVTVSVKSPTGLQFSVLGKVRSPGAFNPGRYVNVLEALSLAGGPSEFAQLSNVVIIRKTPTGTETMRVKLGDLMKGSVGNLTNDSLPVIQGGDTVIVP